MRVSTPPDSEQPPAPPTLPFPLSNLNCPECGQFAGERHFGTSRIPSQAGEDARQMPVYHAGEYLHVGVDQGTQTGTLPSVGQRGETAIRHGSLADGVGADTVSDYLDGSQRDAQSFSAPRGVTRYANGPEVRIIGPASAKEANQVAHAVRLVNAALPAEGKMQISTALPGFSLRGTVDSSGRYFTSGRERNNTIHVEFVPAGEFYDDNAAGTAWNNFTGNSVRTSYIQINRNAYVFQDADSRRAVILLAHEIIHALGVYGHVPTSFDTIMSGTAEYYELNQNTQQSRSLLYSVDREALRALYSRLDPGDNVTDLGPWANTSTHLVGNGTYAHFGVALRNGYAEPWAYGAIPGQDLADNRGLSGNATWTGTLLGFTPAANPVAGDAEIGVNLGTLEGRADFTALEQWAAGVAPGNAGTGTMWGDGDLGYSIAVSGNTFKRTGGDTGILTGIFTGQNHEGATGTLDRSDLTAAFGASR